jgi:hypothetical protein
MNLKGCRRKESWPNLRHVLAFAWKKTLKNLSEWLVSRLRSEPGYYEFRAGKLPLLVSYVEAGTSVVAFFKSENLTAV